MNSQEFFTFEVNSNNNYILQYTGSNDKPIWNITMYYTKDGIYQSDFIDSSVMEYKNNFINLEFFNEIINRLDKNTICIFNIFSNDKNININLLVN